MVYYLPLPASALLFLSLFLLLYSTPPPPIIHSSPRASSCNPGVLYVHCYVGLIHSHAVLSGLFDFAVCAYVSVSAAGPSGPLGPQSSIFHHPPDSAQECPKSPSLLRLPFASSAIQHTLSVFLISFFHFQAAAGATRLNTDRSVAASSTKSQKAAISTMI